jgi:hypothetical protein
MSLVKTLLIAFLLFLMICSLSTCKKAGISFADYLKTLDTIPLPFEHSYYKDDFPKLSAHFDSTGFLKYQNGGYDRPLGILFNDNYNTAVINLSILDYGRSYATIFSFDKMGNRLDLLNLVEYGTSKYFNINKNKRIVVIDTLKELIDNTSPKPSIIKIDSTIYHLSKNGKFIKEKQKK